MTGVDKREIEDEHKFQRERELPFRTQARRAKLLGLWAAAQLGLIGEAADRYAQEVLQADLEKPGVEDIIAKVAGDFAKNGVLLEAIHVRAELERCAEDAKRQLTAKA